jgi:hypothetical protein
MERQYAAYKQEMEMERSKLEVTLRNERQSHQRDMEAARREFAERLIALESNYQTMQVSYEQQMAEIVVKDTHEDNQAYFSHAISEAIREIRKINDAILESKKQHLDRFYQLKVKELEAYRAQRDSEINYHKQQADHWRNEFDQQALLLASLKTKQADKVSHDDCVRIFQEKDEKIGNLEINLKEIGAAYDMLMSTKITLLEEIEVYKKLLESVNIQYTVKTTEMNGYQQGSAEGEVHTTTHYLQNFIGSVAIRPDDSGAFVLVANTRGTGVQDTKMDDWTIEQKVDKGETVRFTFPSNFVLGANKTVKVWSKAAGQSPTADSFVANNIWLTGDHVVTTLLDDTGKIVATFRLNTSATHRGMVM